MEEQIWSWVIHAVLGEARCSRTMPPTWKAPQPGLLLPVGTAGYIGIKAGLKLPISLRGLCPLGCQHIPSLHRESFCRAEVNAVALGSMQQINSARDLQRKVRQCLSPKCLSIDGWINKMWCIQTGKYFSDMKGVKL